MCLGIDLGGRIPQYLRASFPLAGAGGQGALTPGRPRGP